MSVTRSIPDAEVLQREEVWPSRYLYETPPLGLTPLLEEATPVKGEAPDAERRGAAPGAARNAFGSGVPARDADAAASV